ncbi:MAG: ATP-binding protein [Synergistaceae bacterium]|nr:ATP-binding protein [Synergistaceae bacterium]
MRNVVVKASVDNLDDVLGFVNGYLELHNCQPYLRFQIDTAVEEIFMNIANYAYKPAEGYVTIRISAEEKILIRFEDSGKPYNPLEQASPDLDKPVMARKIGGLGVFMVRQLMDEVAYTRADNKNVLTMTKKIENYVL